MTASHRVRLRDVRGGGHPQVIVRVSPGTTHCNTTTAWACSPGRLADPTRDAMLPPFQGGLRWLKRSSLRTCRNGWSSMRTSISPAAGREGQMYKVNVPERGEITAPALLLTTTGRKSGDKFIFPLFYGTEGDSYFIVASKGGAPEHPGWYRNILANPDVEVQVGTKKLKARARTVAGEERSRLWTKALLVLAALCRLCAQDRPRDTGGRAGPRSLDPERQPGTQMTDQTTPRMDGKEPQAHASGG